MLCCKKKKKDEPGMYGKLWRVFIRPHRSEYTLRDLGPPRFETENQRVSRTDFEIKNCRGQTIQASFFEIMGNSSNTARTSVLYAHTHSGSRLESLGVLIPAVSHGINLFTIDMTGSGMSDGQYVSFGIYERDDIDAAVKYMKEKLNIHNIIFWGRSMGAVTLIQYASLHDTGMCMVLDSPFANLKRLCKEVGKKRGHVPGFVTGMFLPMLKKTINKKGNFNINDLDIVKYAQKVAIPTIFIASKDDVFVSHEHSVTLLNSLKSSKKEIMYCKGGHNDSRPRDFLKEVMAKAIQFSTPKVVPPPMPSLQEADPFIRNDEETRHEIQINRNGHNNFNRQIPQQPMNIHNGGLGLQGRAMPYNQGQL